MFHWRSLAEVPSGWGPSAVTIGKFDGVHVGHVEILRQLGEISSMRGLKSTVITFDRPERGERIYVMWNTTLDAATLNLPMGKGAGALYQMDSHQLAFPDSAGVVALELPPATCDYFPFLQSIDITAIGGTPLILVGPLPAANVKMPEPTLTHAPGSRTHCPQ